MNKHVFFSRRNQVWLEDGFVYKRILPDDDRADTARLAEIESENLLRLSAGGVFVPRPISLNGSLLTMEYIEGITLTEAIELGEIGAYSDGMLVKLIAGWFSSFYAALPEGVCRGDVNCRNFILTSDGRLCGVDFEKLPFGRREADLGRLTAFILTYEPSRTAYKQRLTQGLTKHFTELFGLDPALVLCERERELDSIRRRRADVLPDNAGGGIAQ
jgi:tRNA A-37 threonylcarbamoyl transferase component Bud32